ncbi:MAG: M81 family metallopeptidase [Thermoleophilia bacterium]|nr:M81 family metallopeptidase [Thermoleophilia bacterium]
MSLRIGIAGIWHETSTFVPGETALADFEAYGLADGSQAVSRAFAGTATEVGGALEACAALGHEAVPCFWAGAVPGPTVGAATWAALRDRLLGSLERALPLDGLLLALHGALVAAGSDDAESELLAAVRERVGSIPVAVVLDLHGNPGDGLIADSDVLLAYNTFPHTDAAERASVGVGLLAETVEGALAPLVAGRRVPLLTCPLAQATDVEPMAGLLRSARRLEARPGVAAVALLPGYAYADVERLGFAVCVTGEDAAASEAADELAAEVWERREGFRVELAGVEEAVGRALAAAAPVVLAEVSDNVGGGAPGDATHVVAALVDAGARGAVAVLHDPAAAAAACAAGPSAGVEVVAGSPPLLLRGRVGFAGEARYRRTGSYMTGSEVGMGACAIVDTGAVEVVLTSRRVMPFDSDHLRAVGIEPAERKILVVKSAVAWRAAFGDVATEAIPVDTPGPCTCRLNTLPYERRPRPLWPLDPA